MAIGSVGKGKIVVVSIIRFTKLKDRKKEKVTSQGKTHHEHYLKKMYKRVIKVIIRSMYEKIIKIRGDIM